MKTQDPVWLRRKKARYGLSRAEFEAREKALAMVVEALRPCTAH